MRGCFPCEDPHIVEYTEDRLYFLDAIPNTLHYNDNERQATTTKFRALVAELHIDNLRYQAQYTQLYSFEELVHFMEDAYEHCTEQEGYVLRDAKGFMFKFKGKWFLKERLMRSILVSYQMYGFVHMAGKKFVGDRDQYFDFLRWLKTIDREQLETMSYIEVRKLYQGSNKQ